MVLRVSIPSFRKIKGDDDSYTDEIPVVSLMSVFLTLSSLVLLTAFLKHLISQVFLVDVWFSGRHHKIEKRYSEFEELHKQLKKIMKTPEFPPKKVLKWNAKILEQRRLGLHSYFQGVVDQDPPPHALLLFLETDVLDHSMDFKDEEQQNPSHQPVIALDADAFLQEKKTDSLPDIVNKGVIQALYSPALQFGR